MNDPQPTGANPARGLSTVDVSRAVLWACSTALAAFLIWFAFASTARPIVEDHAWRQTQTAISVLFMLRDRVWIDYLTPVLGAPWTIPFEAPVYHLIVAGVASFLPLELSGRLVSAIFMIGTVGFSAAILRRTTSAQSSTFTLFVPLALAAPLHLFWGRAFLIESCALFFGAAQTYCSIRYLESGRAAHWICFTSAAVLCVLAKATTWPAFAVLVVGLAALRYATQESRDWRRVAGILAGLVLALIAGLAWTMHSDQLKMQSSLGALQTSSALKGFNFGTLEQRTSRELWSWILLGRIVPDVLGKYWQIALLPIAYLVVRRDWKRIGLLLLLGLCFLTPLLVFTNLHLIHTYYQTANGLFLVMTVAVALGGLFEHRRPLFGLALVGVLLVGQVLQFRSTHWLAAFRPNENDQIVAASRWLRDHSDSRSAMLAFGIDWSAIGHYYAERKGIAFTVYAPSEVLLKVADDLPHQLGGMPVGSILDCRGMKKPNRQYRPAENERFDLLIQQFRADPNTVAETFGGCTSYGRKGSA